MSGEADSASSLFIRAVSDGNLTDVKKFVLSHGLSRCEGLYGGYALLRDTIESGHFEIAKFLVQQGINVAFITDRVSTPLHFATRQNCVELVELLLGKNAPINARNGENETALHIAAKKGYVEIIKVLLRNNADLTAQTQNGSTPLLLAIERRAEEVVRVLLQHAFADVKGGKNCTPLVSPGEISNLTILNRVLLCNPSVCDEVNKLIVCIVKDDKGHSKIIGHLIDYGFVLSRESIDKSLLLAAIKKKYKKLIKSILTIANPNDAKQNLLLLHSAVKNKQKKIVNLFGTLGFEAGNKSGDANFSSEEDKLVKAIELLLASGANIKDIPDLLHTFVETEMVEVCKVLIGKGADINALNADGETPLHVSCNLWAPAQFLMQEKIKTREKITQLLLDSGADPNIRDSKLRTALHIAVGNARNEMVSALLDFGANVNLRDKDGSTPLHLAFKEEMVAIFYNNKANLDARDSKGMTPLHCAALNGRERVLEKLLKFGADIEVRGPNNETALHFAFSPDHEECGWSKGIVALLLHNGCDANAKTKLGETVLDLAYSKAESNFEEDPERRDYGLNYGSFDPESNLSHGSVEAVECVKQHLIKLEVAGLCEESQDEFDQITDLMSSFKEKCKEEVKQMKKEQLNSEFKLYDVLVKSKNLSRAKLMSLWHIIKSFDFKKYPIYKSLVQFTLNWRKLRLDLIESGHKSLGILIKTCSRLSGKNIVLPIELAELIVSYLRNSDLKSLIFCSDVLKRQLSL